MRYLMAAALVTCLPGAGSAQLVTLIAGWRFAAGPAATITVEAGPLFGADVKPFRWRWGAAGVEISHAPRFLFTTESTSQLGAVLLLGPQKTSDPFGELAVGYYRTTEHAANDTEGGVYARAGVGYQVKPWPRGPVLLASVRYRVARRGHNPDAWTEWFNDRQGAEFVVGVRF